ncbi:Tyrosine-protein phosphatase non-receptor type 3 [Fragariocoptes setiger]|uniref:protein-tyrosine-phosphatase n=1 Tax=Fragariocoptes setiger TaxID=1670756 RepID=A0ABQ7S697_9ACAR|nr:Tyrosine-protein phosphatase non-receptor type 3 [Fragariocoptes setiger]
MDIKVLRGPSGTYNVRDTERTSVKPLKTCRCIVTFLDDTQQTFDIDKKAKGQTLLDQVFQHLDLIESDFFGLKFVQHESQRQHSPPVSFLKSTFNTSGPLSIASLSGITKNNSGSYDPPIINQSDNLVERWLEPNKTIRKQFKSGPPYTFQFRVRFYVSDPSKLHDEQTRYHFVLQIKQDILEGRLLLPPSTAITLASYILQSQIGDYSPEEHKKNYVSQYKLMPNQNEDANKQIAELHKQHKGQTSADAEFRFLSHAKRLDRYGIEFYPAKDSSKLDVQIGVSFIGISVFKDETQINTFSWAKIIKIMFKRKHFFVQLRREGTETCDHLIGFNLLTNQACKTFWMNCAAHHSFFRLPRPKIQSRGFLSFFNLGSRFRYSGKTEYQTIEECRKSLDYLSRSPSKQYARRTIPNFTTARENHFANGKSYCEVDGAGTTLVRNGIFSRTVDETISQGYSSMDRNRDDKVQPNGNGEPHAVRPNSCFLKSLPSEDRRFNKSNTTTSRTTVFGMPTNQRYHTISAVTGCGRKTVIGNKNLSSFKASNADSGNSSANDKHHKVTRNQAKRPKTCNDHLNSVTCVNSDSSKHHRYENDDQCEQSLKNSDSNEPDSSNHSGAASSCSDTSSDSRVIKEVRMLVGADGRYGFNVQSTPDNDRVLISKVGKDSPAQHCDPKLEEGDQVIKINGHNVAGSTHEEIVKLIKSIREKTPPELVLEVLSRGSQISQSISPSSESGGKSLSASNISHTYTNAESLTKNEKRQPHDLEGSIIALKKSIENGDIIRDFESLARKKPEETLEESRQMENVRKNRYQDILPYDSTRVILSDAMTGDYINASFVNMEIPRSEFCNRYIATQGPLPSTCDDFWQMIWEQRSSLIIMVTPLIEDGRVKCHKYWPDEGKEIRYGQLSVKTQNEKTKSATIDRRLIVTDIKSGKKHVVTQVQYLAWPDHEIPGDCSDFLKLVNRVKKHRSSRSKGPVVVHCSAGIGRTGVLILMETALCMMEVGQPIYPLQIVEEMRSQRGMLIQTSNQFKFVTEAIVRVYEQKLFKQSTKRSLKRALYHL